VLRSWQQPSEPAAGSQPAAERLSARKRRRCRCARASRAGWAHVSAVPAVGPMGSVPSPPALSTRTPRWSSARPPTLPAATPPRGHRNGCRYAVSANHDAAGSQDRRGWAGTTGRRESWSSSANTLDSGPATRPRRDDRRRRDDASVIAMRVWTVGGRGQSRRLRVGYGCAYSVLASRGAVWVYKHGYTRRTRPAGVLLKGALHPHSRTVKRTPGHPGQPSHYPEATLCTMVCG